MILTSGIMPTLQPLPQPALLPPVLQVVRLQPVHLHPVPAVAQLAPVHQQPPHYNVVK